MNPASGTAKPPISPPISKAIEISVARLAFSNWLTVSRRAPWLM